MKITKKITKFGNHTKVYIIASVFGLSLIMVVPIFARAQGIKNKEFTSLVAQHAKFHLVGGSAGIGTSTPPYGHAYAFGHFNQRAYFGTVSSVTGSSFALTSVKKNATSTFEVQTDATTTIKKDGVTDVLGDIAVGQHVVVMGALATSTKTISAKSVNIITHTPTQHSLEHVFTKTK